MSALRKDRRSRQRLIDSVAQGFVAGMDVDWRGVLGDAHFVELPTYAFERRRFWLSGDGAAADAAGLGLAASEHALLGAVVELPASGGVVLTGRLSPSAQGWLADHAIGGRGAVPRRRFRRVGDPRRRRGGLRRRRRVEFGGAAGVAGRRGVGRGAGCGRSAPTTRALARSRSFPAPRRAPAWLLHAEGVLSAGSVEPSADLSVWPPAGAVRGGYRRRIRAAGGARLRVRSRFPGLDRRCGDAAMSCSPK